MVVGAEEDGVAVVVVAEDGVVVAEVAEDGAVDGAVVFHFPYHISYMHLPRKAQIVVQKVNILLRLVVLHQKHF